MSKNSTSKVKSVLLFMPMGGTLIKPVEEIVMLLQQIYLKALVTVLFFLLLHAHSIKGFRLGIPKITSVFGDYKQTQHVVAHMAKIYYNERIRKQDKQDHGSWAESLEKTDTLSKVLF